MAHGVDSTPYSTHLITLPHHSEIGTVSLLASSKYQPKFFLHCTITGFPKFIFTITSTDYYIIYEQQVC